MALIKSLTEIEKDTSRIHDPVSKAYISTVIRETSKYIQIDTFGSIDRKLQGKISQSMQFDKETAEILMRYIKKVYPDIK